MKRAVMEWSRIGCFLLVTSLMAQQAVADGYRNPPEGAAALGRGGTRYTYADDATALIHNPATLTDLDRPSMAPTVTFAYSKTDFTSARGGSEDAETMSVLPAFAVSTPFGDGAGAVGVAVNSPYGQASEWGEHGIMSGMAPYYAEMVTVNVNPAAAVRLGKSVTAGVGLNVMRADLTFRETLPWPLPPGMAGPSSRLQFEGDGYGVGGNAGLTWQVTPGQRLALSYRGPVNVQCDGSFDMDTPPPAAAMPPTFTPSSSFATELHFPTIVALGYGVKPVDTVRIEANVEWLEHSRNETMDIDIGNNNPLLAAVLGSNQIRQDWKDTWTVGLGVDWQFAPPWVARAGWTWLPTPTPDATLMPVLAESDRHMLGAGLGYHGEAHALDLAGLYSVASDRTVDDPRNPVQGTYEFTSFLVAMTYAYTF
jgi:long-chain fatty acid transport protein